MIIFLYIKIKKKKVLLLFNCWHLSHNKHILKTHKIQILTFSF